MPISAKKIVYDTYRKYNALISGKAKDVRVVDIVATINDSAETIIEAYVCQEDQNRAIRNHLKDLVVKQKVSMKCKTVDENCCIIEYPEDHYATSNIVIEASHSCCSDSKKIPVVTVQSDDLHLARENPYRQSNFFFDQAIGDEAHDGYYIYHDCNMNIKNVWIEYIRKYKPIQAPSLTGCNKNQYKNYCQELIVEDVDFDLCSTYINRKVSDLAAYQLAVSNRDLQFSQAKLNEIINLNQIYK